ncbi:molybdopterin molybdenumtransferase MoeA [Pararhodobacter marinus]|uniref:Molybdopterin molybdenumtransferase n=1 Tax=Pararhodobacter marinus TaxID=2184063 RepID=A0A2U2C9A2_9RHOB|nr:gephyrin-like molybdotransferase Glp [Pararhodobacter marinus]PWE28431.1 molybdopterin molybdenumtransferase MoeA [Pararhodobacter marinus]
MIRVAEAEALCLALVKPSGAAEAVSLAQAAGRTLARAAVAQRAQPPFRSAAMDGYALRDAELAVGAVFSVIGESAAGHGWRGEVGPGQAVRIFTGAPVPEGADHVVIQEDVTREGDRITIQPNLGNGPNIRAAGGDFEAGFALDAGRALSPADLALLAAMNVAQVEVAPRPRVALLATGDELVMPGENPGPDQIIASNTFALKAMVDQAGGEGVILPIAPDRRDALEAAMAEAAQADIAVTIGGASVGDYDLVGQVGEALGMQRAFYKIAMRPGKPLIAGTLSGKPYLGLPGNPVSAVVTAHLFLLPMVRRWLGQAAVGPARMTARLGAAVGPTGPRTHYMRARLEDGIVTPFERQDSALLSVLAGANVLLERPLGDGPREAGEAVPVLLL